MALDRGAAESAIAQTIGKPLGIDTARAAWGIHEIINEDVARAFRVHASERGIDYRRCSMIVFGGSGPLHGTRVARKLRVPRIVCPIGAGVMSAFGLLSSPLGFELVRSRRLSLSNLSSQHLCEELERLGAQAGDFLIQAGAPPDQIQKRYRLDMRYEGQGYEIEVPVAPAANGSALALLGDAFDAEYRKVFGIVFEGRPIEIVNWKAEAEGPHPGSEGSYRLHMDAGAATAAKGFREAWLPDQGVYAPFPVIDRYALRPGDQVAGPALIEEHESTCVLGEGDQLVVDEHFNLLIEIGAQA
jgi:N-methylhydantoinase A